MAASLFNSTSSLHITLEPINSDRIIQFTEKFYTYFHSMSKYIRIIILFLIIISTGGIYYQFYSTIINTFIIIFSIFLFFLTVKNKIYFRQFGPKIILISLVIISNYALNNKSVIALNYLTLYSSIIAISILIYHYNAMSISIISDLNKILKLIIIHSILNFFIVNIFSSSFLIWDNKQYFETNSFYKLFFFNTSENGSLFKRNCGLFWEPGILQIFINLYVFFRLFILKNATFSKLVICFGIVLSTFSTAGLLIFFIITIAYYRNRINRFTSVVPIILLIIIAFTFLKSNLEDKFQGENKTSSQARIYDTVIGTFLILEKPLWGYGFKSIETTKAQEINKNNSVALGAANLINMHERGNTNSIIMNFVYWGIPIGVLIIFLLINQSIIHEKKILFSFICILSCATEPLLFANLFLVILLSGYFKFNINQTNSVLL